jgi:hypothetical protein
MDDEHREGGHLSMAKLDLASVSYDALYDKASQSLASGDFKSARENLYEASRVLYRLAQLAKSPFKERCLERSEKLSLMADCIILTDKTLSQAKDAQSPHPAARRTPIKKAGIPSSLANGPPSRWTISPARKKSNARSTISS